MFTCLARVNYSLGGFGCDGATSSAKTERTLNIPSLSTVLLHYPLSATVYSVPKSPGLLNPFSFSHPAGSRTAISLNGISSSRLSTVLSTKVLSGGEIEQKRV